MLSELKSEKVWGKLFKVVVKSDGLWYTISNVKLQRINEKVGGEHE